ncbi:hypothetical protein SNEBB_000031 [Seison nebaliae]|nr:hypothetical protein SNEBB_000031 [Seison nebaliae]
MEEGEEVKYNYPYSVEYAKSGRSRCKACHSSIEQDSVRLAIMVQAPTFDGRIPQWYHFSCFFKRVKFISVTDIKNFPVLRWDDQERIKNKISGKTVTSSTTTTADVDADDEEDDDMSKYQVEYAKSGRSRCKYCKKKIDVDTIRIGVKQKRNFMWIHFDDCFTQHRTEFMVFNCTSTELLPGFDDLEKDDKKMIEDEIKKITANRKRKIKVEEDEIKEETEEEASARKEQELLKEQNISLWKLRDEISNELPKSVMVNILTGNDQHIPIGSSSILEFFTDVLKFGALELCEACTNGKFTSSGTMYRCTGNLSSWTKCSNVQVKPKRKALEIDEEYLEDYEVLKNYRYVEGSFKLFPKEFTKKKTEENSKTNGTATTIKFSWPLGQGENFDSKCPLKEEKVLVFGSHFKDEGTTGVQMKKRIEELGGIVTSSVSDNCLFVLTTLKDFAPFNSKTDIVPKRGVMKHYTKAKNKNIYVVRSSILDELEDETTDEDEETNPAKKRKMDGKCKSIMEAMEKHKLCDWSATLENYEENMKNAFLAANYTTKELRNQLSKEKNYERTEKTQTVQIKDGTVIDPLTELDEKDHSIYKDTCVYKGKKFDRKFTAVLGMVDVSRGRNTFYKLQLIQGPIYYYLFRSWGRIGTTIGSSKLEDFDDDIDYCKDQFNHLFSEKTGNSFDIPIEHMTKNPGKLFPLDIDFSDEKSKEDDEKLKLAKKANEKIESKLKKEVKELMELIFDIEQMKSTLLEFEIDLKKMPLGKISKNQINKAFNLLKELENIVENEENLIGKDLKSFKNYYKWLDLSNQFYTLIPHDYGMKTPPLLSSITRLKQKTDMLSNLLDIELAFNIITNENAGKSMINPIDQQYDQLKVDMKVVDHESETFEIIQTFMKNTHATTHSAYKLELIDAFEIDRNNERKLFEENNWHKLHNRKLLWHGSRLTNFGGILSQGLRIAPPEAPCTGYMFGKGVYFADMVSKSANYCCTSRTNNTGLLLLCEVALGNTWDKFNSHYVTKLPKNFHSTKGCGRTAPSEEGNLVLPEGLEIPMGKGEKMGNSSSLLYNEFIVYDTNQIKMKYLLRVKFQY